MVSVGRWGKLLYDEVGKDLAAKHKWNFREVTEEYLASLADIKDFQEKNIASRKTVSPRNDLSFSS